MAVYFFFCQDFQCILLFVLHESETQWFCCDKYLSRFSFILFFNNFLRSLVFFIISFDRANFWLLLTLNRVSTLTSTLIYCFQSQLWASVPSMMDVCFLKNERITDYKKYVWLLQKSGKPGFYQVITFSFTDWFQEFKNIKACVKSVQARNLYWFVDFKQYF